MSVTVEAIYENGVLKLDQLLPFEEHAAVRVTIEPALTSRYSLQRRGGFGPDIVSMGLRSIWVRLLGWIMPHRRGFSVRIWLLP